MISIRPILLFGLALFSVHVPASAQLSSGYSGYSSAPTSGTDEDYWYLVRQLGGCLTSSKAEESVAFLATQPGSAAEGEAWDDLFSRRVRNPCMQNFVSASLVRGHVRGAMAEAMFERAMKEAEPQATPVFAAPEYVANIYDFASCYVATNYSDARALLSETKASTNGELQFIREMAADFGPCLPDGAEVQIVPVDVRFAIAEALYRTTISRPAESDIEGAQ